MMRLALPLLLVACNGAPVDTGDPASPCPETCWSGLDTEGAVFVCEGAAEGGDGSHALPFTDLAAAVDATRASAAKLVLIGSGSFPAHLELQSEPPGGGSDDGLALVGCGADRTELVGSEPNEPVVRVSGASVRLADLATREGRRALWSWQGAELVLDRVEIRSPMRLGVVVSGEASRLRATDTWVLDPAPDVKEPFLGYGISVQDGRLEMSGGGVRGATGTAVLLHGSTDPTDRNLFTDVEVRDTRKSADGSLGRGITAQDGAQLALVGGLVTGNADAGLFALGSPFVRVEGTTFDATIAAAIPGESATSGDGIVIRAGDQPTHDAQLTGVTVTGSARAGMLFDGVIVRELTGNTLSGNLEVEGAQILLQGGAVVEAVSFDDFVELAEPLPLNGGVLDIDRLTD